MKTWRRLHLWVGLLVALLVLLEAITGLFLNEPWLIGINRPSPGQADNLGNATGNHAGRIMLDDDRWPGRRAWQGGPPDYAGGQSELMKVIRGLHTGKLANADLSVLLDITAIGLIILTVTGIILAITVIRAQLRSKMRKADS